MASTSMRSTPTWKYDVFLSFRGEDTRKSFCGHLYATLDQKRIFTFKDNHRLERGKVILSELFDAIEKSMFSVAVILENYASSKWCPDELANIVECLKVMENFEKAFAKHEKIFVDEMERVQKWRDALREIGNLSGWHLEDREESEVIQEIVNETSNKVRGTNLKASGMLVGIDSRKQQILSMLGTGMKGVRMIGIYGMGGIGKTTVARVVFDSISNHFDGGSFLANVREVSQTQSVVALQEQLISETLMENHIKVWDTYRGRLVIRNRLCHKRVLVILDDVNELGQLQALAGERDWFGLGSRIIITTRDRHLLVTHGVDDMYMVEKLNGDEAFQLFCWNAFRNTHLTDGYFTMLPVYSMVNYADGLPLTLEVLGSFLYGRSKAEWKHALDRLKEVPDKKFFEILKISYNGLHEMEKKLFLDIACLYKGKDKDGVREFLNSCNFFPDIAIRVLIDKCIITLSNNKLCMHDLIQDMGKEIVRQENPNQPGQRSRLWRSRDSYRVLMEDEGTEAVEGIVTQLPENIGIKLNAKSFSRMKNLRLLKIHIKLFNEVDYLSNELRLLNGIFLKEVDYISNELRLLKWYGYPFNSLPSNFQPRNLYKFSMPYSNVKQLWRGAKVMNHLKIIRLSHSPHLTETPNFIGVPNLERLILEGCSNLTFLHPSVGLLKRLNLLNLKDCRLLGNLPACVEWESLEVLILSGCLRLRDFEYILGNAKNLLQLQLDRTSIGQVPLSIQYLTRLTMLNLQDCRELVSLPSSIFDLRSLKILNLNGCSRLNILPETLEHISSLEKLDLGGTAIQKPPSSILLLENLEELSFHSCIRQLNNSLISFLGVLLPSYRRDICIPSLSGLCSLRKLDLGNCNLQEGAIPNDIGYLSSLQSLNLSMNNFVSLPAAINQLSNLETFNIECCKRVRALPELPSSLKSLFAHNCTSLVRLSSPSNITKSTSRLFDLSNCFGLSKRQGDNSKLITFFRSLLQSLLRSQLQGLECRVGSSEFNILIPRCQVPDWFTYWSIEPSMTIFPSIHGTNLWKGQAFYVEISIRDREIVPDGQDQVPGTSDLQCFFKNDNNHGAGPLSISISSKVVDGHLWLCYISRGYFSHNFLQDNFSAITATFTPSKLNDVEVKVKACGLHLVYSHDIE